MTLPTLVPDGEKVANAYLRGVAEIIAMGARVLGKAPDDPDSEPWVRITQIDAQNQSGSRADHLIAFFFQFDCYASKAGINGIQQAEAQLLGRTVRAALIAMPDATHASATVTRASVGGPGRRPDTTFEPARERMIITATVWMHP